MEIKKLSIENFKCFKKADFDLGRVTLLTGANSSGKSSVIYSILGAIQSGEFPFQFSPNGKYVNMGNFREMSHQQKRDQLIKIGIHFEEKIPNKIDITTYWEEDKKRKLPRLHELELQGKYFSLHIKKRETKYLLNFECSPKDFDAKEFDSEMGKDVIVNFLGKLLNNLDIVEFVPKEKAKKSIKLNFKDFNELDRLIIKSKHFYLAFVYSLMKYSIVNFDKRINFISSFRLYPQRTYYEKSKTELKVGRFGENYEDQIILWETRKTKEYRALLDIMKNLSLLEDIASKRLEGGRYELLVKTQKNGVLASLNDVGFGISQFLPIIVADLQLDDHSTLFLAQPEIHLHPSVQSAFGDYVMDFVKKTGKKYVIETHSEYLINKIRLGIVKNQISAADVRAYYLQNNGDDVTVHELTFTTDGRILNAPEDFFKTYMMDVMDIAMNAKK
jgi:predicted ATPase